MQAVTALTRLSDFQCARTKEQHFFMSVNFIIACYNFTWQRYKKLGDCESEILRKNLVEHAHI